MPPYHASSPTRPASSVVSFRYLIELLFLLIFLTGIPSLTEEVCTPNPAAGVGVVGSSSDPYVYIVGRDGHLWTNLGTSTNKGNDGKRESWGTGTNNSWHDLGVPPAPPARPGTTVTAGVDVVTVSSNNNNNQSISGDVYVQGSDGHLWKNSWNINTSQREWTDLGVPPAPPAMPGTTISAGVGVTTVSSQTYAFVLGSDGHLWAYSAGAWSDHGTPLNAPPGTTVTAGIGVVTMADRGYVFVQTNDGHVWSNSGSGNSWSWIPLTPQPVPTTVRASVGVGVDIPDQVYGYVVGEEGHLWRIPWNANNAQPWTDLGTPSGTTVSGGVGVVYYANHLYVFVRGSEGHLWANWSTSGNESWTSDLGAPQGGKVRSGVGLVTVNKRDGNTDLDAFVLGSDGFLWRNQLSRQPSGNLSPSWVDQSALIVNMIPFTLSYETNQDSEPFLSVNPSHPGSMVASAFTPNPSEIDGPAPVYLSNFCGRQWTLNNIIPSEEQTGDITHAYSGNSYNFYAGILGLPGKNNLVELKTPNPGLAHRNQQPGQPNLMSVQQSRSNVDQPFVQATTVAGNEHIYIGNNDDNVLPHTATVDVSLDGGTTYHSFRLDTRPGTNPSDGPAIRVSMARDNTIYAAYFQWTARSINSVTANVVVVRDDHGATGSAPFTSLIGADTYSGVFVAANRQIPWTETELDVPPGTETVYLGQERIGSTLSIAVDPNSSSTVYVAWGDEAGNNDIYTIHVSRSTDRGVTWSQDLRTITNATNPALAVAANGTVGLLYQQLTQPTNGNWVTQIEQTKDGFTTWTDTILSTAPDSTPVFQDDPYLGDYDFLLAVDDEFRGVFSANNTPDLANFPQGVLYQRWANFQTHTLTDGKGNSVRVSIDPFFFSVPVLH